LSGPWLQAGFALIVLGYGTKVGFAPLHAWKPDSYGEAPAPVSALLAGASPLCFLLGILRLHAVLLAAGHGDFARQVLVAMGVVSVAVGAALVVGQRDFKRLLAYSSVEHMGVLALGFGAGGAAVRMAFLHAIGNGLAKTLLFLSLGDVHRDRGTRLVAEAGGTLARLPATGALLLVGWAAAMGLPPFPLFQSEIGLIRSMFENGQSPLAAFLIVALGVSFAGLTAAVFGVAFGAPPKDALPRPDRYALFLVPSAVLALLLVGLGVCLPDALSEAMARAAAWLGDAA
jgi:hydrogenase-4 component F